MDKNAIKKYAVWARRELITRVSQRAAYYEITEENTGDPAADTALERPLTPEEKTQRRALIENIRAKGYREVMEEIAYTWFNRFIALRFMEVNGYLPSHVRVFTDDANAFKPQILTEAINLELDGLDMKKVYAYKQANDDDGLFKYLVIVQCNALSAVMPGMFQPISNYTELLFPDNLLREGSVIQQMIEKIPEADWQDAVQIIGWLYQYYNSEKKDEVFAALKKNVKITKENIPAATQLFTPDWIVRYMVENSLGRLWVEGHPNDGLKAGWKYYLEEAPQEPAVEAQLAAIRKEYAALTPDQIKCIDPCAGSGHILVYLFDVLMQIYASYGYTTREAVASIIENNLYGLDIDDRAAQLAYFAVMMKARQYDRRFLARRDENGDPAVPQPHVYAIQSSKSMCAECWDYLGEEKSIARRLWNAFTDAKEYGSLVNPNVTQKELDLLKVRLKEIDKTSSDMNLIMASDSQTVQDIMWPLIIQADIIAQKYDVVITNPPYMGSAGMGAQLTEYVKNNYPDSKSDIFAVFIEKCGTMLKNNRYLSMITMHSWMFLSGFEKLRNNLRCYTKISMVHLGAKGFEEISGEVVQTVAFVIRKGALTDYYGSYVRLVDGMSQQEKQEMFLSRVKRYYAKESDFDSIPGHRISYWIDGGKIFGHSMIKDSFISGGRNKTHNNELYVREWWELGKSKVEWKHYDNGGISRKWFGNCLEMVNWSEAAKTFYASHGGLLKDSICQKIGISWNGISGNNYCFKLKRRGFAFSSSSPTIVTSNFSEVYNTLGVLNSCIAPYILNAINPTLQLNVGEVLSFPIVKGYEQGGNITIVEYNIDISRQDWDSFETSWDFKQHPLVKLRLAGAYAWGDGQPAARLASAYHAWKLECEGRFQKLKANEEELNRIFIDIYGLQDELTPEEEDKDVTVHYIVDTKEEIPASLQGSNYVLTRRDVVVSLISYAVGCMFGRYSLDVEGLVYAGGDFNTKYCRWVRKFGDNATEEIDEKGQLVGGGWAGCTLWEYDGVRKDGKWIAASYPPDTDNIIPICDDEYFEDDLTGRFVKFIETVYGKEILEENLKFIADALGGRGQPRSVIRSYFLNDFYADHCRTYQKRPIYWLFDSGKKNGFKALIYMHRYAPDTIARIRTDYVHEQQSRYHTAIADLENRAAAASAGERVKLGKQLKKLKDQDDELRLYEEKIHHLADQMISIDLDDGVKHNYAIFQDVLAKIK